MGCSDALLGDEAFGVRNEKVEQGNSISVTASFFCGKCLELFGENKSGLKRVHARAGCASVISEGSSRVNVGGGSKGRIFSRCCQETVAHHLHEAV